MNIKELKGILFPKETIIFDILMLLWLIAIAAFFVSFPGLLYSMAHWNGYENGYIVNFDNDWYALSGTLLNTAIFLSKGFVIYLAISVVFFLYDLYLELKEIHE